MCGIAAAIGVEDAAASVGAMIAGLRHRGLVSDPIFSPCATLAAGTRRLPIVDAAHGAQPQVSSDGRIHVVLNGEIYNHDELRAELAVFGARFRTHSDVEVAATALQIWGPSAFKRFEGMYALVAIDAGSGAWLAARDPLGVKPLYVVEDLDAQSWRFCSEVRPLLAATERLPVLALPPGHVLSKEGCFRMRPRWEGSASVAGLSTALRSAVQRRIPPEQECAALFSGGLDSTLVLHYARQVRPGLPAYVLGGSEAPDLQFAAEYARAVGVDLRIVPLSSPDADAAEDIARVVQAVETFEPETVRSGHCSLQLAEAVHRDGIRVALSGDGADELFAGYVPLEEAYAVGEAEGAAVREQCIASLNATALQRIDRCGMRRQLEIREPYLDAGVVAAALACGRNELVREESGGWVGKQPLRALAVEEQLPSAIKARAKSPLNEGAGFDRSQVEAPWVRYANEALSDSDLKDGVAEFADFAITTKEELYYIRTLSKDMDIARVPHLRQRPFIHLPIAAVTARIAAFHGS